MKARIHIISTGGTIASKTVSVTQTTGYGAKPNASSEREGVGLLAADLIASVPGIEEIVDISAENIYTVPSSAVEPSNLLALAKRVNEVLASDEIDGVVITHGTDTLEETAFFLHLTVKSKKPVVIVGSMLPASVLSAGGPLNLYNAILAAASPESAGMGVIVSMAGRLLSARDAAKLSTYMTDAFRVMEYGALGSACGGKILYYYAPLRPHTHLSEFDISKVEKLPDVEILYMYQGCPDAGIRSAVERGVDGIVVAGLGCGAIPPHVRGYYKSLDHKPPLVRATRVPSGYLAGHGATPDDEYSTIPAGDFTPHKARILLQLALTKTKDLNEIREIFQKY